jgi:DMSO reductase anchor subunit
MQPGSDAVINDASVLAAGMQLVPGAFLGVLIGIITGIVFALFLGVAYKADSVGAVLKVTPQLLSIPTFWFGGPWVTSKLLSETQLDQLVNSYVAFLAITFTAYVSIPALKLVVLVTRRMKEDEATGATDAE